MKKTIMTLILILTLLVSLVGCAPAEGTQEPERTETAAAPSPLPAEPEKSAETEEGGFLSLADSWYTGYELRLTVSFERTRSPLDYNFDPGHRFFDRLEDHTGMTADWGWNLSPEERAEVQTRLEKNGSVGFVTTTTYLGDHIRLADGTDLGPFMEGQTNGVRWYAPQNGLPVTALNQKALDIVFGVKTMTVYTWLEGEEIWMYYAPLEEEPVSVTLTNSMWEKKNRLPGVKYTVEAYTVDEFLAAIAPDTSVLLMDGVYMLSDAADYGGAGNEYYTWKPVEGGYELVIQNVENLYISGLPGWTYITTDCEAATLLTFSQCPNVLVQAVDVYHRIPGAVAGDGIRMENCENMRITVCDIYNCATGVSLDGCRFGFVEFGWIRDCGRAAAVERSECVYFAEMDIRDCAEGCWVDDESQEIELNHDKFGLEEDTP